MTRRRRSYDTLGRRILRKLSDEYGGPRKKNVLLGMRMSDGKMDEARVEAALERLVAEGKVRMVGRTKGARYALARPR